MLEKRVLVSFLQEFGQCPFCVKANGKGYRIGEGEPEFTVNVKKPIPLASLMTNTSLALGEACMDGDLEIEGNLYYALGYFLGQMDKFSTDESTLEELTHPPTAKHNQQEEVRSRYDIGNDFYKLWLDETVSCSCGYFLHPDDALFQAQVNKVDYILQKLYLKKGMSLLSIGCEWGFLFIEAAEKCGVQGMGITLSEEQYRETKRRVAAEHLEELITVELMDYWDLPKCGRRFDRIVNVGVVEHVGRDHYQLFMDCGKKVLKPDGLFLLHSINDLKERAGDPWIKRYIFQEGVVPGLREMLAYAAESGSHALDVENLRPRYNRALLCWERNYREHLDEVCSMFDERLMGMWDSYLSACAAIFHNGIIGLHQILLSEGINNQLPSVRWYQNGGR